MGVDRDARIEKLEFFDEFEEWELILRHYSVVWAWKGTQSTWTEFQTLIQLNTVDTSAKLPNPRNKKFID